jgi:hypothetical protein
MRALISEQRALAAPLLEGATAGWTEATARAAVFGGRGLAQERGGAGAQGLDARFDAAVTESFFASRDRDAMLAFARAYADLARQEPSRARLEALVRDHVPAGDLEGVLALLAQLTDGDVA